jgi:hypothetical protein
MLAIEEAEVAQIVARGARHYHHVVSHFGNASYDGRQRIHYAGIPELWITAGRAKAIRHEGCLSRGIMTTES